MSDNRHTVRRTISGSYLKTLGACPRMRVAFEDVFGNKVDVIGLSPSDARIEKIAKRMSLGDMAWFWMRIAGQTAIPGGAFTQAVMSGVGRHTLFDLTGMGDSPASVPPDAQSIANVLEHFKREALRTLLRLYQRTYYDEKERIAKSLKA